MKEENCAPFKLSDELFLSYCDLFYEKDINKIEQIINLSNKYYKLIPSAYNEKVREELYNYYDETGIFLIKNGKLINKNLFLFLEKKKNLLNKEIKITEEITKGLVPSDEPTFVEYLMNINDITLIQLCKYYFNKFTLKDFLFPSNQKIFSCKNDLLIKYYFEGLKNAWLKEKPKKMNKELANFKFHLFSLYFNTFRAREEIEDLKVFENEINNPQLFMDIFSIIIIEYFKHYNIYEFRDHINKYINEHYMEAGYESIYYKVLIIDSDDQENFLLNNLSPEYAIKL